VTKTAIMAGSGVGKTSLIKKLRVRKELENLVIGDIDEYLPFDEMNGISPEELPKPWDNFELKAANNAVKSNVNIIFGVMTSKNVQEFFESNGYKLYALTVPEEVQLERILKREQETGKKVNIEASLGGNKKLLGSAYPKIDGNKPMTEVVQYIIDKVIYGK
jgi:hypothetical protein